MIKLILLTSLVLVSILHAKELKDGVYTTVLNGDEVRMITVVDKKIRSFDVLTSNNDDFSKACWTDYDDFQVVTLTSKPGGEVHSFKCANGEYKALSNKAGKYLEVARSFSLSAILYKNQLLHKLKK